MLNEYLPGCRRRNASLVRLCLIVVVCCGWLTRPSTPWTAPASSSFVGRTRPGKCHAGGLLGRAGRSAIAASGARARTTTTARSVLTMRDRSSASTWFKVGDEVRVVSDSVEKAGINLQHRVGRVIETWEKCDVDPTCCCAEQVDLGMAVRVNFSGRLDDDDNYGGDGDDSFSHYFAEEELMKV